MKYSDHLFDARFVGKIAFWGLAALAAFLLITAIDQFFDGLMAQIGNGQTSFSNKTHVVDTGTYRPGN